MATWNDPHPLANPFNTRSHGNFNTMTAQRGTYIRHTHADPKTLTVPNQDIPYNGSPEWNELHANSGLTVPNQDIPLGDQTGGNHYGFLPGRSDIFRLSDGTLLDFKRHIILGKDTSTVNSGYWGDPNKTISMDNSGVVPRVCGATTEIRMEELINNIDKYQGTAMPDGSMLEPLDPKSAAYWLKAEEEAEKLKAGMTDEQKAMIAVFERHFPKSRLIEESKKISGRII